ncbi:LLM class flavin-dependent oxidoreductase [Leifsonia shinshuensis]|uniref:Alkanesulfonate monooxygenase SsuD/methylene tetrahydromethanopterin reductase-like flavin-dependent oxidoreductase (Luciferase family) n=1 Tax=Leifsonia shinshuensis TaxID=150026 RepID=A0A853CPC5_9MICO|nr:alkanesulfonate monooxygenase SsuD/methylene tetrahydromethanopterin reductase-like flavin-dependent oxidoreductase (luciferase family) [Leifsonia shinshuensis]
MTRIPLGILDLVPVPSGATPAQAVAATLDIVRRAEAAGYHRYWFAEHHFNPGVIGSSPAVLIALAGAVTDRIRLGSGAVQLSPQDTEATIAEEYALLATAFPGRIDLGVGRSGLASGGPSGPIDAPESVTPEGLLIPEPFRFERVFDAPKFKTLARLLVRGQGGADFADQVETIVALLADGVGSGDERVGLGTSPAGVAPELRLFGSGTLTARLAGRLGLPFAANYHSAPSGVLVSIQEYRRSFVPSERLGKPHVIVSADVVAAPTSARAAELASGYPAWVRSIRSGLGAIPYPTAAEAAELDWTDAERRLVDDRVRTQFVGTPAEVVERLTTLQRATGADELVLTTITHDPEDRAASFESIAREWDARERRD